MSTIKLSYQGSVSVLLTDKHFRAKQHCHQVPNALTSGGLMYLVRAITGENINYGALPADQLPNVGVIGSIGLGSGSTAPTQSDTALETPIGTAKNVEGRMSGFTDAGGVITYVANFEAGVATGRITEAGLFAGATMIARALIPVFSKGADDALQLTWRIQIGAADE